MNLAFFSPEESGGETFGGVIIIIGSPIWNHLVRLATLDPSDTNTAIIAELRDWVFGHMKLPKNLIGDFNKHKL